MKPLVIYHKNCADGIASAWVMSKVYPNAIFHPMAYGESLPELSIGRDTDVIFVDFSLKAKELQELALRVNSVLVIDHHKTAEKELQDFRMSNVTIKFDMSLSGAQLAWRYYFPDIAIPNLVNYVGDRDLWKFELSNSEAINSYIQSWPMTIEDYDLLATELNLSEGLVLAEVSGEAILRYKKQCVDLICKNASIQMIRGHRVPALMANILISEVGHELCKQYTDLPFSISYLIRPDGTYQYSLRSIGDFDVSKIALSYGGGGHKNAAGFESPLNVLYSPINPPSHIVR